MKLVIIGNGIAGITTARVVSDRDPSIDIAMYSEEPYQYYARPRLVDLVAGRVAPEQLQVYSDAWYAERGIKTLLRRRVADVDPAAHRIALEDGSQDRYDALVLAMGAHAWVPPVLGAETRGVHTLRALDDALALRDAAAAGSRVLVLGGGLLGLETAVALRNLDVEVTVVEVFPRLLPKQLDTEGAAVLQEHIHHHGVEFLTGDSCAAIEGRDRVERAVLKSGRVLDVDLVVISAGARSNIDLAQGAGIDCHRGIVVDDRLLTDAPDVYAVGDVAEFEGRTWGIIPAAMAQARVAAARIAGDRTARYEDIVPATTLKVTGVDVTSIGEVNPEAPGAVEVRATDPEKGTYHKLVVRDGRVVGAILVGSRERLRAVNLLISRGIDVTGRERALLDPEFDLMALVPS